MLPSSTIIIPFPSGDSSSTFALTQGWGDLLFALALVRNPSFALVLLLTGSLHGSGFWKCGGRPAEIV